jgi:hypothetical protein
VPYIVDIFMESGLQSCPSWAVGKCASGPCSICP